MKTPQESAVAIEQPELQPSDDGISLGEIALAAPDVQYRTEHSRSIAEAPKHKALAELQRLGILVPYNSIDTVHGRLKYDTEESDWIVDPTFRNGGDDSGNNNIHARPVLYTSDKDTAKSFGNARGFNIFRERLQDKLEVEFAQSDPRVWRRQIIADSITEAQQLFDTLSPEEKDQYLDLEGHERAEYQRTYDDRSYATVANQVERERFVHKHRTGQAPEPSDKPWNTDDKHEVWRAAASKRKSLTEEEKQAYLDALTTDMGVDVHEIVTNDTDALVISDNFDSAKLTDDDVRSYTHAMHTLVSALPVTIGTPLSFEAVQSGINATNIAKALKATATQRGESDNSGARILDQDVTAVSNGLRVDQDTVAGLAAGLNARNVIVSGLGFAAGMLLRGSGRVVPESYDKKDSKISTEYIARFMREMHIVGQKSVIDSTTLGREIDAVSLFDLDRVNTQDYYDGLAGSLREKMVAVGEQLGAAFEGVTTDQAPILAVLQNQYAAPRDLVVAAKKVPGFAEVLEADAGNWEGYILEEHTETVLRNFDENYADKLPVKLLAPLRMALIVHDIGKPLAFANGEKHLQKSYNAQKASEFMDAIALQDDAKEFILSLIGQGMEFGTQVAVFGRDNYLPAMRDHAAGSLKKLLGTDPTKQQINGYLDMCEALVTCDGGAYTSMAVTTRPSVRAAFRNAGSFDTSFEQPVGMGERDLKLKHSNISSR